MKNQDIRREVKSAGLKLWQIADVLEIRDNELSRKMRYELGENEKNNIRRIITILKKSKED